MGILSNQRKGAGTSRYNFKDDVGWLLKQIEDLRIDDPGNQLPGLLTVDGYIDLAQVNRIRMAAGMPALEIPIAPVKEPDPVVAQSIKNPWLVVTLTGREPMRISRDEWLIVTSAEFTRGDNLTRLTVRRHHTDGAVIVYGVYRSGQNEVRGGEVINAGESVIDAIERVGWWMEGHVTWGHGDVTFKLAVHECIANLPAVDI